MPATSVPDLVIEPLAENHDRDAFGSGNDSLDRYFKAQAGQDARRKINGVFVLVKAAKSSEALGYYTLCATALAPGDVPDAARKHLPRYPLISATLLGKLAVDRRVQGQGFGALLLSDGVKRAYASAGTVGSSMLVVDAIDEKAAAFYARHGFIRLVDSSRLILPMRTIAKLLQA